MQRLSGTDSIRPPIRANNAPTGRLVFRRPARRGCRPAYCDGRATTIGAGFSGEHTIINQLIDSSRRRR
jgi:hypothetical protein